jgi:hypothetical protein
VKNLSLVSLTLAAAPCTFHTGNNLSPVTTTPAGVNDTGDETGA